jgi:5-methyltetrahydropteroyltriglutamate--homocysteine methyltransferase
MKTYRADHVGSLLRPQALLDARKAHSEGRITLEELRAAEDKAILQALDLQRQAGLHIFSDGEFRRTSWVSGLPEALNGVEKASRRHGVAGLWKGVGAEEANSELPIDLLAVTARLKVRDRFTGVETAFLKAHSPGAYKVTMPSPTIQLNMFEDIEKGGYADEQALLDDLVRIYQTEVAAQIDDGAAYIQLDSLRYAQAISGFSPNGRDLDPERTMAITIAADNAVLGTARARGVTTAVHVCRGNHRSAWAMSGAYDAVAERLLNEVETDRFLLEYDDERSGGFAPLRFTPKGKTVVLGLVTTKVGALEDADELVRRVDEAAKHLPLEQLAISPQCGFASTYLGNLLTEDDEKRKLELVAKTAERIWGSA